MTLQQAFDVAVQHHQAGRLPEAEAIYRQILALDPGHARALHFLGVIAHQVGRNEVAVELIREAIALTPDAADFHSNLGLALKERGQWSEAIAAYRQAIALKPTYSAAHSNLGMALVAAGRFDEAVAACRRAIELQQNYPEAYCNLGNALYGQGRLDEAIAAYRQAIAIEPNFAKARNNLGTVLRDKGRLDEAIAACREAIALQPNYPEAHSNLGNALHDRRLLDEAIAAHLQAITLHPDFPEAYCNLGAALRDAGQLDEAITACRHAIALKPEYPEAYGTLASVLKDQGQIDEAIAGFQKAIALKPDFPAAQSSLLLTLNYHPDFAASAVTEEHRRWSRQHAEPLTQFIQMHRNDRTHDRRLRIGYVSPDLRAHPVGRFLLPLLAHHDHDRFEVFGYAHVPVPDAMTARLRSHADAWRSLVGLSDAEAAGLIREDEIDILVDLAGHTANHRLLVFARRPAPVQVTWLGYPNTTGLAAIDFRLTDPCADPMEPQSTDDFEELIRVAPCAWCFDPGPSPPVARRLNGPVTFGSFNNWAKVSDPMLRLWGRILAAVPDSRLLLKSAGTGSTRVRQRVRQVMEESGIAPERLELRGHEADHLGHLALYERMDIALDTYPYHGTTTTCEALWMGVPVVTLAGHHHAARVGVSLLTNAGLPEFVAETPDDYFRLAVTLASDLPRLAHLRATMRDRLERSPLMDAPRFARDIEAAYREMWRQWCAKPG